MAEQFTATVTPTATGGVDAVSEVGSRLNKAQAWDAAFGTFVQSAQTAEALTVDERRRQSQEDMAKANIFVAEEKKRVSQMPAGEQEAAWQSHIDKIQNGESEESETYNRTLLNSILPSYTSAAIEHKRQLTENDIRMSTDTAVLESINTGNFGDTSATIKETASRLNVDVARVRDSYYGSFYGYYRDKVSGISDNEPLNGILDEMKGAEKTLNSPQLLGNSSTGESGTFLRVQKSSFASTLSSTKAAIAKNNKLIIQATENKSDPNPRGRYPFHPRINKDRYTSIVEYNKATMLYENHHSDVISANNFNTEESTYFDALTKGAQEIVKQDITTSLVNNFDDFDGEVLANTLISQKANANNGIRHIKTNLYSVNEEISADSFMKIQQLRGQPNGEEALNVIFSKEDERNKFDAIVAVQEAGIVGSVFEANKFMNQPTVPWKFSNKREEGNYNNTFSELPVKIGNRGREVYKVLRAHGVDHATSLEAGEKAVSAKSTVGDVDVYGTGNLVEAGATVQRSVGTHLNLMTKPFGTEITHSYDMWSDSVISTNEYGVIVSATNKNELVDLATSVEAFQRDAKEHNIAEAWEGAMDSLNTTLQTQVLRTPARPKGESKIAEFFRRSTYTVGKGFTQDFAIATEAEGEIMPDIAEDFTDKAERTISTIYSKEVDGTKKQQLEKSVFKYMKEILQIEAMIPPESTINDANAILFDIYRTESSEQLEYSPTSTLSREEFDGINGNLARQKRVVEDMRTSMGEESKALNVRNNNPGNIKLLPANEWEGQTNTGSDDTFSKFNTPQEGIRALSIVADKNIDATDSYVEYVNRYASEDNEKEHFKKTGKLLPHLENYAKVLADSQGVSDILSKPTDVDKVEWIKATIKAEGGEEALMSFSDDVIQQGIELTKGR